MGRHKNNDVKSNRPLIDIKDILNTSWLYFQQHAQQRISYFNFFVAFSTLLTTGMISTFKGGFGNHYIGIFLGIAQAFLSLMFLKIDKRNKELTKHGENILKKIEKKYYTDQHLRLFCLEEQETDERRNQERKKYPCMWCKRGMSHGNAFLHIFWFFGGIGLIGTIISTYVLFGSENIDSNYLHKNNEQMNTSSDSIPCIKSIKDSLNNSHNQLQPNKTVFIIYPISVLTNDICASDTLLSKEKNKK